MAKVKGAIIMVGIVLLIGGYYFYLSNKGSEGTEDTVTAVQNVILRNLETDYPPSPKEVVKYYSELAKCLYNENYTDEQFSQMTDKLLAIYDDDLVANNPRDQYVKDLTDELDKFEKSGYTIASYEASAATDVDYYNHDGRECASLYCKYSIRSGGKLTTSQQEFVLRKDLETGHWKILGFELVGTTK